MVVENCKCYYIISKIDKDVNLLLHFFQSYTLTKEFTNHIHTFIIISVTTFLSIFSNKTTHQIRLRIAGAELNISAEDIDYSNKAEERLTCDYQGDDIQIGFNSRFLSEMLSNINADDVQLEMSLPNRAGILTPVDGLDQGEQPTMLVMPVMLNS